MPIFRWGHHWDALQDFEREIDRLLESVNLTFQGLRVGRQYPPVNVYELSEEYLVTAELSGLSAENLDLTIAGGVLTMRGSRDEPDNPSEDRYRRQERPQGTWQRSLTVPDRVDHEKLTAEFHNGILKIRLPKSGEAKRRQIPVTEGPH